MLCNHSISQPSKSLQVFNLNIRSEVIFCARVVPIIGVTPPLEQHFINLPTGIDNLELIEAGTDDGTPKFSFRNLLTLHRPLVIVDESQNAATKLMHEVFTRIQPECLF